MSDPVPEILRLKLAELQISHETVTHPAFFTVEEGRPFKVQMPGGHTKNLFLKDKAGTFTFVCASAVTQIDLKLLAKALGARGGRLSFVKGEVMTAILGVTPGAVTPFALMNDAEKKVSHIILDAALMREEQIWVHPLHNEASTALSPWDLKRFIEALGVRLRIYDFSNPEAML